MLSVTIIQSDLHWQNIDKNLAMFSQKIDEVTAATDVILLPEMFTTGFSMESEKLAETMDGKGVNWMRQTANTTNAAIVGSLIIKENNHYYNRLIWANPTGEIYHYDKRHLFRMADEHQHFTAGNQRLIIEYKDWKICPLICYDLRFPVWSRNVSLKVDNNNCHTEFVKEHNSKPAYDCAIYLANWPAARKAPWSKLLEARAIENQCYVIGVNRVGQDGKEISYSGNTAVVNPKGEVISNFEENNNQTLTYQLDLEELNSFREKFPVGMDADQFDMN